MSASTDEVSSASATNADDASEARRRRAAARKEKILSRGSDRLAQITSTARGEEGAKLFDGARSYLVRYDLLLSFLGVPYA